jgi:predicted nucleotidyltransferase component of viral defense system
LDEGFTIYVYTPEMIVFEKIRAICQQMEEYGIVVQNHGRSARARDFFDIYTILQHFEVDFTAQVNIHLIKCIFEAKRVPLQLISLIQNYREFHRPDFDSVKDTVKTDVELKDFDFYFDYIVEKCLSLKSIWEI